MRFNQLSKTTLHEGVRFGKKELNATLEDIDKFIMGIEYEFFIPSNVLDSHGFYDNDDGKEQLITVLMNENGIGHIERIHGEHDSMTEVVTGTMSIPEGLKHIKDMLNLFTENDIEVPNTAGMHVSISMPTNDTLNHVKFITLMSGSYLDSIFPERDYTNNATAALKAALNAYYYDEYHEGKFKFNAEEIEQELIDDEGIMDTKYSAINFSDYFESDGRVELRYFGGKDYHERYEEIQWQVIRAVFMLGISYSDMYDKEYQKMLYKLFISAMNSDHTIIDVVRKRASEGRAVPNLHKLITEQDRKPLQFKRIMNELMQILNELPHTTLYSLVGGVIFEYSGHSEVGRLARPFIVTAIGNEKLTNKDLSKLHGIMDDDVASAYIEDFKKEYIRNVKQGDDTIPYFVNLFGSIPEIDNLKSQSPLSEHFIHVFSHPTVDSLTGLVTRINNEGMDSDTEKLVDRVGSIVRRNEVNDKPANFLRFLMNNMTNKEALTKTIIALSTKTYAMLLVLNHMEEKIKATLNDSQYIDYQKAKLTFVFSETQDHKAAYKSMEQDLIDIALARPDEKYEPMVRYTLQGDVLPYMKIHPVVQAHLEKFSE